MIRRFLALFRCEHLDDVRVRKPDGSYHVQCERCGRTKPLVTRTTQELAAFQAKAIAPQRAKKRGEVGRVVRWGKP